MERQQEAACLIQRSRRRSNPAAFVIFPYRNAVSFLLAFTNHRSEPAKTAPQRHTGRFPMLRVHF